MGGWSNQSWFATFFNYTVSTVNFKAVFPETSNKNGLPRKIDLFLKIK